VLKSVARNVQIKVIFSFQAFFKAFFGYATKFQLHASD